MSLIALTAAKGAPGVTTAALALAAVWPARPLLVEADPAGSDLLWRLRGPDGTPLDRRRGLLSLASTLDSAQLGGTVWEQTQPLAGGLELLAGLPGPEQARTIGGRWEQLAETLAALDVDVLADCGRCDPDSPALPLVAHARLVVGVTRPTVDGVAHMRRMLGGLATLTDRAAVLVVADPDQPRAVDEVRDALAGLPVAVRVLGPLALDPAGARLLYGGTAGRLDRSLLMRTARPLAATVAGLAAGTPAGVSWP